MVEKMSPILYALSFLLAGSDAIPRPLRTSRSIGTVFAPEQPAPPHSTLVPFWLYQRATFTCRQPGLFADDHNCKLFYECMPMANGNFVRHIYKCDVRYHYSIEKEVCVPSGESTRSDCRKEHHPNTTTTTTTTTTTDIPKHLPNSYTILSEDLYKMEMDLLRSDQLREENSTKIVDARQDRYSTTFSTEDSSRKENTKGVDTPVTRTVYLSTEQNVVMKLPSTETVSLTSAWLDRISKNGRSDDRHIEEPLPTIEEYDNREWNRSDGFEGCRKDGFFPNPSNCSEFYRCVDYGIKIFTYRFSCPKDTIWDDYEKSCNFPNQVKKENTCMYFAPSFPNGLWFTDFATHVPFTERHTADLNFSHLSVVCPTDFRLHPKYCNLFYRCTTDRRLQMNFVIFACPEGMTFSEKEGECTTNQKSTKDREGCAIFPLEQTTDSVETALNTPNGKLYPTHDQFP